MVGRCGDLARHVSRLRELAADLHVRPRPRFGDRRQRLVRHAVGERQPLGQRWASLSERGDLRLFEHPQGDPRSQFEAPGARAAHARRCVAPRQIFLVELDTDELAGDELQRPVHRLGAQDRFALEAGDVARPDDLHRLPDRAAGNLRAACLRRVDDREIDRQRRARRRASIRVLAEVVGDGDIRRDAAPEPRGKTVVRNRAGHDDRSFRPPAALRAQLRSRPDPCPRRAVRHDALRRPNG